MTACQTMDVVWPCYNQRMSNIHHRTGHHGLDDESNYGRPNRCAPCWAKAKTAFFAAAPRRGVTLASVYTQTHIEAHSG